MLKETARMPYRSHNSFNYQICDLLLSLIFLKLNFFHILLYENISENEKTFLCIGIGKSQEASGDRLFSKIQLFIKKFFFLGWNWNFDFFLGLRIFDKMCPSSEASCGSPIHPILLWIGLNEVELPNEKCHRVLLV